MWERKVTQKKIGRILNSEELKKVSGAGLPKPEKGLTKCSSTPSEGPGGTVIILEGLIDDGSV